MKHKSILCQGLPIAAISAAIGMTTANAAFDVRFYMGDQDNGGIPGGGTADLSNLFADSSWPDSPDMVDLHVAAPFFFTDENTSLETSGFVEWPQDGPGGYADVDSGFNNYGAAVSGVYYPPQTGWYRFHIRSDDQSFLFVNTTPIEGTASDKFLDPTSDSPIAFESGCCNAFQLQRGADQTSDPVYMEVGQGFALELVFQEGGGGDWFQVGTSFAAGSMDAAPADSAFSTPSVMSAGSLQRDVRYGASNADGITGPGTADDGEIDVDEAQPFCCATTEFDKDGVATVQWEISTNDGDDWDPIVDDGNLVGAQSPSLSFQEALLAWDGVLIRAVVDGVADDEIEVAINADTRGPNVVSLETVGTIDGGAVRIEFDEPIDVSTLNADTLIFSPAKEIVEIRPVGDEDRIFDVDVGVFDQTPFSVTIEGVTDIAEAKNEIDPELRPVSFGGSGDPAVLLFDNMTPRIGGSSAADWLLNLERLQADPRFPGNPTHELVFPNDNFNIPQTGAAFGGSDMEDFAGFTFGTLTIPSSGDWTFAIRSDDSSAFYLSSDDTTQNLPPIDQPTVAEYGCCGALGDNGGGTEVVTLNLDAGDYAFEAYYFEYAGGDYFEIGWAQGDDTIAHIPTSNIRQAIDVGQIELAELPDQSAQELLSVTYEAVATGTDKLGIGYQWFVNGDPVPGETGPTFTIDSVSNANNGDVIQVAAFNNNGTFSTVFSNETVLTVIPDTTAPALRADAPIGGTPFNDSVAIFFDEPVSLTRSGSGSTPGSISGAALDDAGDLVIDYVGTLQAGPTVVGPWETVASSGSATQYMAAADSDMMFFRAMSIAGGTTDGASFTVTRVDDGVEIPIVGDPELLDGGQTVVLNFEGLGDATRYMVDFSGVTDLAESANSVSGSREFISYGRSSGGLTALFYEIAGGGLGDLATAEPGEYPENFNAFGFGTSIENIQNRLSSSITYFESPQSGDIDTAPPADVANDYAQIVFGWVRPEVTGDYRFFLASDDNAQLWLSTDDDPANAELIAEEPVWNGVRIYDDTGDPKEDNWSDSIALVAGQEYYIEARNSEGGGGDNLAVAWTFTTDGSEPPLPANGSAPIAAQYLISNVPVQAEVEVLSTVPGQGATGVYFNTGEFSVSLRDGVIDQVDPATVSVTVGGAAVEVTVDSTDEGVHTIEGTLEDQPRGETVDVVVAYTTVGGSDDSLNYSFTVESMPTLDPAWAVGLDQGTDRGFDVRVVQAADAADRVNSTAAAESQLNNNTPPAILETTDIFDVINFNQDSDDGSGGNGVFRGGSPTAAYQIPDTNMNEAGLLTGLTDVSDTEHTNEWAMEVKTYLAFPEPGIYTFGVNSDDGFRLTAGPTTDGADSQLELGVFDGGRGAANDSFQSIFRFEVEAAGIYAVRFIGYEGGGGSSMELYSIENFGTSGGAVVGDAVLINDDGGITAYTGRASEPGE